MIVIADTSPFIALTSISHIQILPALFGSVTIPPQVATELANAKRPQAVRDFIARIPPWLRVKPPINSQPIPLLQSGETAAIHLALELNADLLLIDEIYGRQAAYDRNLKLTGTVGVIELAADQGLLDLKSAFDQLKQTDFWISHRLLDQRLTLFLKNRPPAS